MKKLLCVLLALAFCVLLAGCGKQLLKASEDLYCTDIANVIGSDTENEIIANSDALRDKTGAEIAVVTVKDLSGLRDTRTYAKRLFNEWGVGDKTKNNGFLLVLLITPDPDDGNYYLATGDGAERIVSNSEADDMLYEELEPYFENGQYDEGVKTVYRWLFTTVNAYYNAGLSYQSGSAPGGIDRSDAADKPARSFGGGGTRRSFSIGLVVFAIIAFIVIVSLLPSPNRPTGYTGYYPVFLGWRLARPRRRPRVTPPPPSYRSAPSSPLPVGRTTTSWSSPSRPSSSWSSSSWSSSSRPSSSWSSSGVTRPSSSWSSSSRSSSSSWSSSSRSSSSSSSSRSSHSSFGGGHSAGGGAGRRR